MAYYPKNKIKTNLYTSGNEFIVSNTNGKYIGYYYKLYNGEFFTGNTPNSLNSLKLIPIIEPASDENSETVVLFRPQFLFSPTPQDYKNGEFIRYFIIKRNEPIFIEITKSEYDKYKNQETSVYWRLFKPFSLFWVLTGDINQVAQTNRNVTQLVETKENALGLSIYLKENYTQYYKANP